MALLETGQYGKKVDSVAAPVPTLTTFWQSFCATHALVNNKISEQETKRRIADGHFLPRFGTTQIDHISVHDVKTYKADMVKLNYRPKTINNHLTILRTVLKTAVRWGVMPASPDIRLLRNSLTDVTYLDFEPAQRLVEAADSEWRPMVVVALNTGLRIGELLGLHWAEIDMFKRRLRVSQNDWKGTLGTPKSGKNQNIPLNRAALLALRTLTTGQFDRGFCAAGGACERTGNVITRWKESVSRLV